MFYFIQIKVYRLSYSTSAIFNGEPQSAVRPLKALTGLHWHEIENFSAVQCSNILYALLSSPNQSSSSK
jgi:hypothetical protein